MILVVLGVLAAARSAVASEIVRLANRGLQFSVDAATGRLVEFTDRISGHNFAAEGGRGSDLWSVDYMVDGTTRTLSPTDASKVEVRRVDDQGSALRMTWSQFTPPGTPEMSVEIVARLEGSESNSRWEIAITKPRSLELAEVRFPRLTGLPRQANEFLAVPVWSGELLADPRQALLTATGKGRRVTWDYPGRLSLQCLAFYQRGGPGLYLACDDAAARRKSFAVQSEPDGDFALDVSHLAESGARESGRFTVPYRVIIGTFQGDWVTAAERYREWGAQQSWARESRLRRGATPEWARDTALWVWNRGQSDGVLGPAAVLQQELGLPVSVLWHWWHGCAYDVGFPEYLPPREGAEPFRRALVAAHAHGLHAIVYMNQRLWGLTTRSWSEEGAERFAVKGPDGTFRREIYNTFTGQACVSMCLGTAFWRDKYAGIAERVVREFAVDGIYMDQACSSLSCYDPAHGHPLGGGSYWMDGFRRLSTDIRQRTHTVRPPALAGEGSGEAWLPYLDLMLSLQVSRERYAAPAEGWEPIPFFAAVYHGAATQFGNYSSLTMPPYDELWPAEAAPPEPLALLDRKFSTQFRLEQARAFVWGQQPMLANFRPLQLEVRATEIAYVLRLARLRQRTLSYLRDGEFLRPPALAVADAEFDLSRLSIYAGQKGGLTTYRKRLPLAVAGAWRATGGNVAIALANITDQPLEFAAKLDLAYYRLPVAAPVVRVDAAGGRTPIGLLRADGVVGLALESSGACVLEFLPHQPPPRHP